MIFSTPENLIFPRQKSGTCTSNKGQSVKASVLVAFVLRGSFIVVKLEQFENAHGSISIVAPSGIVTSDKEEQKPNAHVLTFTIPLPMTTDFRFLQLEKAPSPMLDKVFGNVKDSNAEHSLKAPFSILWIPSVK